MITQLQPLLSRLFIQKVMVSLATILSFADCDHQRRLEWLFQDDPNVFVAGDLLWYPTEGNNVIRAAPDAMVIFGRPKGDREALINVERRSYCATG